MHLLAAALLMLRNANYKTNALKINSWRRVAELFDSAMNEIARQKHCA
jgi:hypothetical protein